MALTYHYDALTDVLTVNGVKFAGAAFAWLCNPDPDVLYRMERQGDQVVITRIRDDEREDIDDALALVTKTRFAPGDALVIRMGRRPSSSDLLHLHESVKRLFKGGPPPPVVVLQPDSDVYALPEAEARKLYEDLRRRFANG